MMDTDTVVTHINSRSASASSSRRHSCGTYVRNPTPSADQTVKIFARSITQGTLEPSTSKNTTVPTARTKSPLIDLKFIEQFVKKGRKNSERQKAIAKRLSYDGTNRSASEGVIGKNQEKSMCDQITSKSQSALSTKKPEPHFNKNIRCVSARLHFSDRSSSTVVCYGILESLFVGGVSAAMDEALLRRLKIDQLIDLRNTCVLQDTADGRKISPAVQPPLILPGSNVLTLFIDQFTSNSTLAVYFQQINTFVTQARMQGKRVLVYDHDGKNEAAAAVIQYLMYYYKMSFNEAHDFVCQIIPGVKIPSNFDHILRSDCAMEKIEASSNRLSPPVSNGPAYCRQGVKYDGHKKHLAWA